MTVPACRQRRAFRPNLFARKVRVLLTENVQWEGAGTAARLLARAALSGQY